MALGAGFYTFVILWLVVLNTQLSSINFVPKELSSLQEDSSRRLLNNQNKFDNDSLTFVNNRDNKLFDNSFKSVVSVIVSKVAKTIEVTHQLNVSVLNSN
jgi:hypothetical protein